MKIKFKVSIGGTTSIIIIISTILIISYSFCNTSKIIYNISKTIITRHMELISKDLKTFLIPIQNQTKFLANVINDKNYMNNEKREEYLDLMKENMYTYKQIAFIYIADEKGNWTQVRRIPELATRMINRKDNKEIWEYRNNNFEVTKTIIEEAKYDHRIRPWYLKINKKNKEKIAYWSSPYTLTSINKPGITVSYPLFDKNSKEFFGSISTDVTLSDLSNFFKTKIVYNSQLTFIVDENGSIISYSGDNKKDNIIPIKTNISSLNNYGKKAYEVLNKGNSEASFTYKKKKYFSKKINVNYLGEKYELITVVDEKYLYKEVFDILKQTIFISILILFIALFFLVEVINVITRTIEKLNLDVNELKRLNFLSEIKSDSMIYEIYQIQITIESLRKAMLSFSRYNSINLVKNLIKNNIEAKLGGNKKIITLMFTDIENFTAISEEYQTNEVISQLSDYFKEIDEIVNYNLGTVDKFIGDGTMSFWGAPIETEEHAVLACNAALECKMIIDTLNEKWEKENKPKFKTRFGINTGETIVGNVGSSSRMSYTAMGDSVNVSSRLESLCKLYKVDIIISNSTYKQINTQFFCRPLGKASLKGKKDKAEVYQLIDNIDNIENHPDYIMFIEYLKIYSYYSNKQYETFSNEILLYIEKYPKDIVAQILYSELSNNKEILTSTI